MSAVRLVRAAAAGPDAACPAWVPAGARRRLDPLARTACAAVEGALAGEALPPDTALVVDTSYGAVESTHRFVKDMAAYGDGGASPTPFTASVHNSAAGALGELLRLQGPCTTLSHGATGALAALRWALLMLGAGRAPAALVVCGDRHNDWSRGLVRELAAPPWPVGDGAAAWLLRPGDGPGRAIRWGEHAAPRCLDGGGIIAEDEARLATAATGQRRTRAGDRLGRWWPCCLAAALAQDAERDQPVQLREAADGRLLAAWVGPERA